MEEYKVTSADFYTPGDTGDVDSFIDIDELNKAAGKSKMAAFLQQAAANTVMDPNSPEQIHIIREEKFDGQANRKRIN